MNSEKQLKCRISSQINYIDDFDDKRIWINNELKFAFLIIFIHFFANVPFWMTTNYFLEVAAWNEYQLIQKLSYPTGDKPLWEIFGAPNVSFSFAVLMGLFGACVEVVK